MSWSEIGLPQLPPELMQKWDALPDNVSNALIQFGGATVINAIFGDYWGIFGQNGIPLLLADNVVSLKTTHTSKVSNAPIEQGSFTSYNKVQEPFTLTVQFSKGSGGVLERGAFLGLLDALAKSHDLYMVITPEAIYPNCAIVGYDYAREAGNGARLLKVNVHLAEVRLVEVEYTKTQSDSAQAEVDNGKQQTQTVANQKLETTQEQSILSKIGEWFNK